MSKVTTKTNTKVEDFVLNNEAEFDWVCYPHVPGDGGHRTKMRIGARFKHVSDERRIEVMEQFRENVKARVKLAEKAEKGEEGGAEVEDDDIQTVKQIVSFEAMLLEEVLVSFKYVKDPKGNAVLCTPETKTQLISNSWARKCLLRGYQQAMDSRDDAGN
jgi:hypothetical protein